MEDLLVESLGNGVGGVAKPAGLPVTFIRGALPGEVVRCEPAGGGRKWREAELLEILSPSSERVDHFCPVYGSCGGCSLQHLGYAGQLHWKREWISSALARAGLVFPEIEPVRASPVTTGYRNRVTFLVRDGRLHFHRYKGDPLPVSDCPLLHPGGRRASRLLDGHAGPGPGSVSVRSSFLDGRTSLEFDCPMPGLPLPGCPGDMEIWHRDGCRWKRRDGDGTRSHLRENIAGVVLSVPPGGFFQVNTLAASAMVASVVEEISSHGGGRILDLYGGAGSFSIPLAVRGVATVCVDSSEEALEAGRHAAEELPPGAGECVRLMQDACRFLEDVRRVDAGFDAVISDPPRSGMGKEAAGMLRSLGSPLLVMVSCNPFTLARDLGCILDSYSITRVVPFDLFPHTDHVETVCVLEKKPGKRG